MEAFLRECATARTSLLSSTKTVHVVVGNAACDLDSTVSALCWAYYLSQTDAAVGDGTKVVIPLLAIPRHDYASREISRTFLSVECNIDEGGLVFMDDVDCLALAKANQLEMTLVDHNDMTMWCNSGSNDEAAVLVACLRGVIDHHQRSDTTFPPGCDVTIERVGSCATLVADLALSNESFVAGSTMLKLLYGAIVFDTVCLSPAYGRVTPKDDEMASAIEAALGLEKTERHRIFDMLNAARANMSGLATAVLLTCDRKLVIGTSARLLVPSVPLDVEDLLHREDLAADLGRAIADDRCDAAVVMTLGSPAEPGGFPVPRRHIIMFSQSSELLSWIVDALLASDLKPLRWTHEILSSHADDSALQVLEQSDHRQSRKMVLPLLQRIVNDYEAQIKSHAGNQSGQHKPALVSRPSLAGMPVDGGTPPEQLLEGTALSSQHHPESTTGASQLLVEGTTMPHQQSLYDIVPKIQPSLDSAVPPFLPSGENAVSTREHTVSSHDPEAELLRSSSDIFLAISGFDHRHESAAIIASDPWQVAPVPSGVHSSMMERHANGRNGEQMALENGGMNQGVGNLSKLAADPFDPFGALSAWSSGVVNNGPQAAISSAADLFLLDQSFDASAQQYSASSVMSSISTPLSLVQEPAYELKDVPVANAAVLTQTDLLRSDDSSFLSEASSGGDKCQPNHFGINDFAIPNEASVFVPPVSNLPAPLSTGPRVQAQLNPFPSNPFEDVLNKTGPFEEFSSELMIASTPQQTDSSKGMLSGGADVGGGASADGTATSLSNHLDPLVLSGNALLTLDATTLHSPGKETRDSLDAHIPGCNVPQTVEADVAAGAFDDDAFNLATFAASSSPTTSTTDGSPATPYVFAPTAEMFRLTFLQDDARGSSVSSLDDAERTAASASLLPSEDLSLVALDELTALQINGPHSSSSSHLGEARPGVAEWQGSDALIPRYSDDTFGKASLAGSSVTLLRGGDESLSLTAPAPLKEQGGSTDFPVPGTPNNSYYDSSMFDQFAAMAVDSQQVVSRIFQHSSKLPEAGHEPRAHEEHPELSTDAALAVSPLAFTTHGIGNASIDQRHEGDRMQLGFHRGRVPLTPANSYVDSYSRMSSDGGWTGGGSGDGRRSTEDQLSELSTIDMLQKVLQKKASLNQDHDDSDASHYLATVIAAESITPTSEASIATGQISRSDCPDNAATNEEGVFEFEPDDGESSHDASGVSQINAGGDTVAHATDGSLTAASGSRPAPHEMSALPSTAESVPLLLSTPDKQRLASAASNSVAAASTYVTYLASVDPMHGHLDLVGDSGSILLPGGPGDSIKTQAGGTAVASRVKRLSIVERLEAQIVEGVDIEDLTESDATAAALIRRASVDSAGVSARGQASAAAAALAHPVAVGYETVSGNQTSWSGERQSASVVATEPVTATLREGQNVLQSFAMATSEATVVSNPVLAQSEPCEMLDKSGSGLGARSLRAANVPAMQTSNLLCDAGPDVVLMQTSRTDPQCSGVLSLEPTSTLYLGPCETAAEHVLLAEKIVSRALCSALTKLGTAANSSDDAIESTPGSSAARSVDDGDDGVYDAIARGVVGRVFAETKARLGADSSGLPLDHEVNAASRKYSDSMIDAVLGSDQHLAGAAFVPMPSPLEVEESIVPATVSDVAAAASLAVDMTSVPEPALARRVLDASASLQLHTFSESSHDGTTADLLSPGDSLNDVLHAVEDLETPDDSTPAFLDASLLQELGDVSGNSATSSAAMPGDLAMDTIPLDSADDTASVEWCAVTVAGQERRVDMGAIKPYCKLISHGGLYSSEGDVLLVFAACYFPSRALKNYSYVMENLLFYVLSGIELMVPEGRNYAMLYFHGGADKAQLPSMAFLKRCRDEGHPRLRKSLKALYLVHPTMWLRSVVFCSRAFVSSKFSKKIVYVQSVELLKIALSLEYVTVPPEVMEFEKQKSRSKR